MIKTYHYCGPISSCSITIDGKNHDITFMNNKAYKLPDNHEYVQTLIAQKRLVLAPALAETQIETSPASTKKGAK